jgi:hypothetical protein
MSLGATDSSAPFEPRSRGAAPRLAGVLLLVAGLAGTLFAGDSSSQRNVPAGDGRGLATFGDRGLTTFGDRPLTTFGDRGLEKFSDIPLAPMGGLIPGGAAAADHGFGSSGRGHSSSHRHSGFSGSFVPLAAIGTPESAVSIGANSADGADPDEMTLLMPRVELPVVVLDHRSALALLEATLDAEIRRADAAGDGDLARSLDPDRR